MAEHKSKEFIEKVTDKKLKKRKARKNRPENRRPVRHPVKTLKRTTNDYEDEAADNYQRIRKADKEHYTANIDDRKLVKQAFNNTKPWKVWAFCILCGFALLIIVSSLFL